MTIELWKKGYDVNRKRVQRLMRIMGLEAIYPKPNLSVGNKQNKVYPYLLKNVKVERVNQVWATDITYIPMDSGFLYLVAVMDYFSRYVLSWKLSNNLESGFCIEALEEALQINVPEIFNTDQGCQFTSEGFVNTLKSQDIQISMTGKGRCMDNIFVERLWRSVKYEEVYIKDYTTGTEAETGLRGYFEHYNNERIHQSLKYSTPLEVFIGE